MNEFRISVLASSADRELAISQFRRAIKQLEQTNFADTNYAGGGSAGGSISVQVSGPPEPPLSESELRRLRAMIAEGAK